MGKGWKVNVWDAFLVTMYTCSWSSSHGLQLQCYFHSLLSQSRPYREDTALTHTPALRPPAPDFKRNRNSARANFSTTKAPAVFKGLLWLRADTVAWLLCSEGNWGQPHHHKFPCLSSPSHPSAWLFPITRFSTFSKTPQCTWQHCLLGKGKQNKAIESKETALAEHRDAKTDRDQ